MSFFEGAAFVSGLGFALKCGLLWLVVSNLPAGAAGANGANAINGVPDPIGRVPDPVPDPNGRVPDPVPDPDGRVPDPVPDPDGRVPGERGMRRGFVLGALLAALCVLSVHFFGLWGEAGDLTSMLGEYVFFIFFFASSVIMIRFPHAGFESGSRVTRWLLAAGFALGSLIWFAPEAIALLVHLRELAVMRANPAGVAVSSALGAFMIFASAWFLSRRPMPVIGGFFGPGQLLLFVALLKLMAGGEGGFDGLSLLPSVQSGAMKFVHDVVHQCFVYLLVPDHPLLRTTTWNFIGALFGPGLSMALSLMLLLLPPVAFMYASVSAPLHIPAQLDTGAERRLYRRGVRMARFRLALPVALFALVVIGNWFITGSGKAGELYVPAPLPLVVDGPVAVIPIKAPGRDLMDGRLHTFSLEAGGHDVRLLVVKKTDGRLAVALDACEICPPEGYGQREGFVVCIYCATPIALDTLGKPGGCNPIPLVAEVTGTEVRVAIAEIQGKWESLVLPRIGKDNLK